jgi:hypothetical protein
MVSRYTRNLINVIEEEAKVNRMITIPFIRPEFISRLQNYSWKNIMGEWSWPTYGLSCQPCSIEVAIQHGLTREEIPMDPSWCISCGKARRTTRPDEDGFGSHPPDRTPGAVHHTHYSRILQHHSRRDYYAWANLSKPSTQAVSV